MKLRRFLLHSVTFMAFLLAGFTSPMLGQISLSLSSQLCDTDEISILVDTDIVAQSYKWTGPSISDDSQINARVDGPGQYTLTIISDDTSHSHSATIEILDIPVEDFTISSADIITCSQKQSLLSTDIRDTDLYTYSWTSFAGNELGTEATLEATYAGIYFLEITNVLGCKKKSSVDVIADFPEHVVSLRMDSLTCNEVGKLYINSQDVITAVQWTGPVGFNSTAQNPDISAPGYYKATITFDDTCQVDKTIRADYVHFAPDIETTGDVINCDIPAVKVIKNSNPNHQYQWRSIYSTFTSTEAEPLIDHNGVFEIKVMDNSGCEAIYYELVKIDTTTADFEIVTDTINCAIKSTLLDYNYNTSNFLSYEWSGPGITEANKLIEKPMVNEGGVYSIVGKTKNGCPFGISQDVIKDIEPINITNEGNNITIDCKNTNIPLTVDSDRASEKYQWFYNGALISQLKTFQVSDTGDYMAKVIGSNGCSDQAFYTVDGDIIPPMVTDNSMTTINCEDTLAVIDIVITDNNGTSEYTYEWYNETMTAISQSALNYETSTPGTYILVSQNNENGCSRTDSIIVNKDVEAPDVEIYTDIINCKNKEVLVQVTSDTLMTRYNWTTEAGTIDNVSEVYTDGSQAVILRSTGANMCISTDTIIITHDTIAPISTIVSDPITGCSIDQLSMTASSEESESYTYEWYSTDGIITSDNKDSLITIDKEGIYYLTTQSKLNYCTSIDSIDIKAGESQLTNIDLEISDPKCSNDDNGQVIIYGIENATGELSYALNDNQEFQSDPMFDNLIPEEYIINVVDGSGCTYDTIIHINPGYSIDIEAIESIEVEEGLPVTISTVITQSGNTVSYSWSGDNIMDCDSCSVVTFDAYTNETISVIAEDENGCTDIAAVDIIVNDLPDIWLANTFSPSANMAINRSLPIYTAAFVQSVEAISVNDRWGNAVLSVSDLTPDDIDIIWDGTYNGQKLSDGVYSVNVKYTLKSGEQISVVESVTLIN